jgi:hypothetical protein
VKRDLLIEQGVDWSTGWRVTYNGTPIDSDWTAAAQIRERANRTSPLLHTFLTSVDDTGAVVLAVPHAASESWAFNGGFYDVEITSPDQAVRLRVAQGAVRVAREVTTL